MAVRGDRSVSGLPMPARGVGLPWSAVLGAAVFLAGCGDTLYDPVEASPEGPGGSSGTSSVVVEVQVDAPDRIELTDSISIRVRAWDGAAALGIARIGYSAAIRSATTGAELARTSETTFERAPGDTVSATFVLRPDWLSEADLPEAVRLEVYGWAEDPRAACAAAVPEDPDAVFPCSARIVGVDTLTVASARSAEIGVTAVRGRTTPFRAASILVGDLQVDTLRERVYLSNRLSSRVHIFEPGAFQWGPDVAVGSEPWGLHLNGTGDTLLVANSGGTSVSKVSLSGTPAEIVPERIQTRNTALFEIELEVDTLDDGTVVVNSTAEGVRFYDFSDRPQHVAQDASGRILYSTRPTGAATRGTVRVVIHEPGWEDHETRVLARIPLDVTAEERSLTVLHADSVNFFWGGMIEVWDHRPGFPSQIVRSGIQEPLDALETLRVHPDSDVEYLPGSKWELDAVSFSDTTYVATSRDRMCVAFGDGGEPEVGRIVMWHTPTADISRRLRAADLLHNSSERVTALEMNRDGSLGIARGSRGMYFFSNDLQLRGTVPEAAGGGGAALHPDHPDTPAPVASDQTTVAFTMGGDRTLRIVDTVHYIERGSIQVRDGIGGPLRVTPPLPSDNGGQGRSCSGPDCVVAKVFAVTSGGGVLVLDVRASDIEPVT